jgi:hypothetical protein
VENEAENFVVFFLYSAHLPRGMAVPPGHAARNLPTWLLVVGIPSRVLRRM